MLSIEGIRKVLYEEFKMKYPTKDESYISEKVQKEIDRIFDKVQISNVIPQRIKDLENRTMPRFLEIHPQATGENLNKATDFLYYAISYHNYLEKLLEIFGTRRILPEIKRTNSYSYTDTDKQQTNKYISLLECDSEYRKNLPTEYDTYIKPNIVLLISPKCNPEKAIYVPHYTLLEIEEKCPNHKNGYSCARGEYQVKESIPLSMVKAIGIPWFELEMSGKTHLATRCKEEIKSLLELCNIDLPIVDTSHYNEIIYPLPKEDSKEVQKKKVL